MSKSIQEIGFAPDRLARAKDFMQSYVDAGKFHGAELLVARHGEVAFHEAVGFRDRANNVPLEKGAVYSPFSVSKTFTSVLTLNAVEKGQLSLTTKVSEIIPEFKGGLRENITLYHVLTHQAGLPMVFQPIPGMYIDQLDEVIAAICKYVHCEANPGEQATYSPMTNHALMGECVRRTDPKKRAFRDIMREDVLEPLGMSDSAVGLRADLRPRKIVPEWLFNKGALTHLGHSNYGTDGAFEEEFAEMPWVGMVTTVADLFKLAEMIRNGGVGPNGNRVLSPITTRQMRINRTGEKMNQLHGKNAIQRGWEPMPAYSGLGVFLRGGSMCHHQFGTLTSPETFGQHGQGSALYWSDPEAGVTFVHLSHGVMIEGESIERFQRLSDIVISSVI